MLSNDFLRVKGSKDLNMNHVFKIMLLLNGGEDIKTSLLQSLPRRKIDIVREPENEFENSFIKRNFNQKLKQNKDIKQNFWIDKEKNVPEYKGS